MKCKYKKFLKAAYINYEEDYCGNGSGTFTKPTITTPVIVITGATAIIACAVNGATIYYTLDGSTPTSNSTKYTGTITLTLSCVIKAIAVKPGMSDSAVATESYVRYLTTWRLAGNSEVHAVYTDPYLTQWKVFGDSVVDNNAILSCGDLGQDGKYHVKISNGATIYDIPLTEPLRKVGDIADSIEFVNGVATLTRNIASVDMRSLNWTESKYPNTERYRYNVYSLRGIIKLAKGNNTLGDILCTIYNTTTANGAYATTTEGIAVDSTYGSIYLYDANYDKEGDLNAFLEHIQGAEMVYALANPTTETIQVSPFPISATDTYTSANDTPYSAFEYKKNVEIWSCGEYSAVDGKYHILVQPLGGSIADIALDEPLRKVNNVADSIEFADGVGTLTRLFKSVLLGDYNVARAATNTSDIWRWAVKVVGAKKLTSNVLNAKYAYTNRTYYCEEGINVDSGGDIQIFDSAYTSINDKQAFIDANAYLELIYELATPITETIQVPQIQDADSYTCVISQGAKAVEWSSFETE